MEVLHRFQSAQYQDSFFHVLDPRVKIWLTTMVAFAAPQFESPAILASLVLLMSIYMLLAGLGRALLFITLFFLVSMLGYLLVEALILQEQPQYQSYVELSLTMLPIMASGLLLGMSTSLEKLLAALAWMRLPAAFCYTVMVAIRYAGMLGREVRQLHLGMRIREVLPSWQDLARRPGQSLCIMLLPLLVRSFKVADRLGASAELRGLSRRHSGQEVELRMTPRDWIFAVSNAVIMVILWFASTARI